MRWVIYCHTNLNNGKRYVGFTKTSVEQRWKSHLKSVKRGSNLLFHNAIRKHGPDAWNREALCETLTLEFALELERHFIATLNTCGSQGYNMNAGGEGGGSHSRKGWKHTLEARQKMSESHKGLKQSQETIAKRVAHLKGHVTSVETKEKLRKQRGWKHSEETRKKLREAWERRRKCK